MLEPTNPRIFNAQNTSDSRRLVAAQARIYSDAKILFYGRVSVVLVLSLATMATATSWPSSRFVIGGGGGLLTFIGSFVAESLEKRRRYEAAAVQELFDTRVFKLEWNQFHANMPSVMAIAQAAGRYRGGRDMNWYEDTAMTHRPFDILICQASNLGWGAAMHRLWAWLLIATSMLSFGLMCVVWWGFSLSFESALLALLIPALAPFKEVAALVRSNFDAASSKQVVERTINNLWEAGMRESTVPTDAQVRGVQDKILLFRQTNAYIPDWLDSIFHGRNEAAMRASVADRVSQALRSGRG